jgi:hypothetical protein
MEPLKMPYAQWRLMRAREKLLALRQFAPTVYTDRGGSAKTGIKKFETKLKQAEVDVGLWEGRAAE